jgi:hypothetical protein
MLPTFVINYNYSYTHNTRQSHWYTPISLVHANLTGTPAHAQEEVDSYMEQFDEAETVMKRDREAALNTGDLPIYSYMSYILYTLIHMRRDRTVNVYWKIVI